MSILYLRTGDETSTGEMPIGKCPLVNRPLGKTLVEMSTGRTVLPPLYL